MSLCFEKLLPFVTVLGSLSDLLGLRLPLPLQSRPAQISEGTQDSTKGLALCRGNTATFPRRSLHVDLMSAVLYVLGILLADVSDEEKR